MNKAIVPAFAQRKVEISGVEILSAADDLFNHVDENLPMWSQEGDRVVRVNISFVRAFADMPSVTLGILGIDADHDQNLRFRLEALNIKREGFTIEFFTWSDTHIVRASAAWQAIGKAKPDIVKATDKG